MKCGIFIHMFRKHLPEFPPFLNRRIYKNTNWKKNFNWKFLIYLSLEVTRTKIKWQAYKMKLLLNYLWIPLLWNTIFTFFLFFFFLSLILAVRSRFGLRSNYNYWFQFFYSFFAFFHRIGFTTRIYYWTYWTINQFLKMKKEQKTVSTTMKGKFLYLAST